MNVLAKFCHRPFIAAALLAASCLCSGSARAATNAIPSRLWTVQTGTTGSDFGRGSAVDGAENSFVVGYTSGSFAGFTNAGEADIFLAKYDPSGNLLWARQLGSPEDDLGFAVAVDTAGSAYVCGGTNGSLPDNGSAGGKDAFLVKYSSAGVRQWTVQFGSLQDDEAFAVATDAASVYVAGYTSDTAGAGGRDALLAKFDPAGAMLWQRRTGSPADDAAYGVAVATATGQVYVAGVTSGTLLGSNAGRSDAFLMKFDSAGGALWMDQFGSSGNDAAFAVAVSTDSAYIAGTTDQNLDGNTGAGLEDAFLTKYSFTGARLWTQQFGTAQNDRATGVAVNGNAPFVAGATLGGMDDAVNAGSWDVFVVPFDAEGNRGKAKQMGTPAPDLARGIAVSASGKLLTAGYSSGSFDGKTNIGKEDAILIKFRPTVIPFLQWTGEEGYADGGVQPKDNVGAGTFFYHVTYVDAADIAPLAGYPKVHIKQDGTEIAGSPFLMTSTLPGTTVFAAGVVYTASIALPAGSFSYYFEAFDAFGNQAVGFPTAETAGPTYRAPEAQNIKVVHGVFKAGEGESCTLSYTLERSGDIGVIVYDSLGRKVRNLFRDAAGPGTNTLVWDGRDDGGALVASGVYVFRFDPGGRKLKKAVVIR